MKKYHWGILLTIVVLAIAGYICLEHESVANKNSGISKEIQIKKIQNEIKQGYRKLLPYYQKIYNCTKYSVTVGGWTFQIVGMENNKCHVKKISNEVPENPIHCYYPVDVAKKYSKVAEKHTKNMINELVISSDYEDSTQYINEMDSKYCVYELAQIKNVVRLK